MTYLYLKNERNIRESGLVSIFLYNKQNYNINTRRLQNQEDINKCENFTRIATITYTLLILYSRAA